MNIQSERLWANIQGLGAIGADPSGGVSRFAWTPAYKEAVEFLTRHMERIGLSVRIDTVGNVYGRLEGSENLPAVLTGSHLDTVPHGGFFDGAAGVMAALEVLTVISEHKIPHKRPIEMIAFINEEASQFMGGLFGSKAALGVLADDYAQTCFDRQTGQSLREAMLQYGLGLQPDRIADSKIEKEDYFAFIELHIEQGTGLLKEQLPIAVVTEIAGIKQFFIHLKGTTAHAGGMSMKDRHDCVAAVAHITCEIERLALASGSDMRATVGYIEAKPGEHNIIAGEAVMSVDFREADTELFNQYYESVIRFTEKICKERNLSYAVELKLDAPPAPCHKKIISIMQNRSEKAKIPCMRMTSFSAHDAMEMARIVPMGMIFLQSGNNGVSHCPEEFTKKEDLAAGTQVLLDTIIELSGTDNL